MRRGKRERKQESNFRYLLYLSGGILLVLVITFIITFISYNNKLKSSSDSLLALDKITGVVPNDSSNLIPEVDTEQASIDIGKTIDEVINSMDNNVNTIQSNTVKNNTSTENVKGNKTGSNTTKAKVEKPKDPEFIKPVEGEISRDFAKENLVFSDTLQEWVVHQGIDIKADRTTVVKSAEAGTVKSIKNDPRYGLTIVIEHVNGFKTIYSNLLTTEFVSEGEKVEKGQSLGTVGNSAAFEIVDEPHLHFEIIKDDVNVDPNIYIR